MRNQHNLKIQKQRDILGHEACTFCLARAAGNSVCLQNVKKKIYIYTYIFSTLHDVTSQNTNTNTKPACALTCTANTATQLNTAAVPLTLCNPSHPAHEWRLLTLALQRSPPHRAPSDPLINRDEQDGVTGNTGQLQQEDTSAVAKYNTLWSTSELLGITYTGRSAIWPTLHAAMPHQTRGVTIRRKHFSREYQPRRSLEVFSGRQPRRTSHRPDDGDGVGLRNVWVYKSSDIAVCPRKRYRVLSPWELQLI